MLTVSPTRLARSLKRRLRDRLRGETDATFFDIHDGRVMGPLLAEFGLPPLRRVPDADTERVTRVYEVRADLRREFPDGLTPRGRGRYLRWLLAHGRPDLGLTADEILAFVFQQDRDPSRGLGATFLLTPDWQRRFPHGLTAAGWPRLKRWLAAEHGYAGRWFRRARRPRLYGAAEEQLLLRQAGVTTGGGVPRGVNVIGHFRYISGLQEAVSAAAGSLAAEGYRLQKRDVPVIFASDWGDRERYHGVEVYDTSVVSVAVNTDLAEHAPNAGLHLRDGVHRVAVWYWELGELPASCRGRADHFSEIWAPTRFIAGAMRRAFPLPVVPMLPGVRVPEFRPRPKSFYGLRDDQFLFLFMFDMGSVLERKNPTGLIEAFRRAFSTAEPVQLAIKVTRAGRHPREKALLMDAAAAAGVTVIDEVLPRQDALALLGCCDAYVSLHRSEGLGLTMAEAMLLGRPVVATGYSGNLDFMTAGTSLLVGHREAAVGPDCHPYPAGCTWADPDLDHAAALMRRVADEPDFAAALGKRAAEHAGRVLSPAAAGRRMARRLEQIARGEPHDDV